MKKFFKIFIIFFLVIYVALFASVYIKLVEVQSILNTKYTNNEIIIFNKYRVKFNKVSSLYRYDSFGITFYGVKEYGPKGSFEHLNPISIIFKPLTFTFELLNNGDAYYYDNNTNHKSIIKSDYKLHLKFKEHKKLLKKIYNNHFNIFEVVNFVRDVILNVNYIKAFEPNGNIIGAVENSYIKLSPTFSKYYNNLEDFIEHKPKLYLLSGKINSDVYSSYRLPPFAILTAMIPEYNLKLNFGSEIENSNSLNTIMSLSKSQKFSQFKLKQFNCNNCEFSTLRITNLNIVSIDNDRKDMNFNGDFNLSPMIIDNFRNFIVNKVNKYFTYYKYHITNKEFNHYLPTIDYNKPYSFNIKAEIYKDKININNFVILNKDNAGLLLSGELKSNNIFDFRARLGLVVKDYTNLSDYWQSYYYEKFYKNLDKRKINFEKNYMTKYIKSISDYPNSAGKDISFHININLADNIYKISDMNFSDVMKNYYLLKFLKAKEKALTDKDPKVLLNILVPEAEEALDDLLHLNEIPKK